MSARTVWWSFRRICSINCGILVRVEDGRVTYVIGDFDRDMITDLAAVADWLRAPRADRNKRLICCRMGSRAETPR